MKKNFRFSSVPRFPCLRGTNEWEPMEHFEILRFVAHRFPTSTSKWELIYFSNYHPPST